jgi:hypothetical protein
VAVTALRTLPPVRGLAVAGRFARRRAGAARRWAGGAALAVEVGVGVAIVLAATERASSLSPPSHREFSPWFAGPLRGLLPSLTRDHVVLQRDMAIAVLAMTAAYGVTLACAAAVRASWVIAAVVALHVAFLLAPPLSLTDLFNYIGYARLGVVRHLNPYTHLPLANRGDPVYHLSNWHRLPSPYGPLFTLLTYPLARLPLPVAYWVYKVAATAASLGMLGALWACARRLRRPPAPAVAFVGLNPILIVYALGGKHNDLIMLALLLAGGWLLLAGREALGGVAVVASVAVKASAALLAPVLLAGSPRRPRALAGAAAGALLCGELALLAFGAHLPALGDQAGLVTPYGIPNLLGLALGHGGEDPAVRRVASIALAASVAACTAVAWQRREWTAPAGWAALAGVAFLSWVMPWYVLWALPFAALSSSRALRTATLVASVYLTLIWSPLMPGIAHGLGLYTSRTPVGKANHHYMQGLLLDHPPQRHHRRHRAHRHRQRVHARQLRSGRPRHG